MVRQPLDLTGLAPAQLRKRVSELCKELAKQTGDGRFTQAAAVLRGKKSGRRQIDDSAPLALVKHLLDAGLARSKNDACYRVATGCRYPHSVDAMRARLMKKMRTKRLCS